MCILSGPARDDDSRERARAATPIHAIAGNIVAVKTGIGKHKPFEYFVFRVHNGAYIAIVATSGAADLVLYAKMCNEHNIAPFIEMHYAGERGEGETFVIEVAWRLLPGKSMNCSALPPRSPFKFQEFSDFVGPDGILTVKHASMEEDES